MEFIRNRDVFGKIVLQFVFFFIIIIYILYLTSKCNIYSNKIDIFIKDMFNPQKKLHATHTSKYFYVLAYAASVIDRRDSLSDSGEPVCYLMSAQKNSNEKTF